jgi:DtxR family transcriptional regulator, Mn-dependent transcriptional regulator
MTESLTPAVEDYLKAIYKLTVGKQRATTNQIAEEMDVAPASATGMIQKMAKMSPPLVDYQKHQGALLTPSGENAALEVIRHHRLLELYLHERLGFTWDQVHSEADRLEHVISEEFEERIAQALGNPSRDPHGDPIPTRDFQIPEQIETRLSYLRPGQAAIVRRVVNTNPEFLRYLGDIGLVPDARLAVIDYSPFDENLVLSLSGRESSIVLGFLVTSQVYVTLFQPEEILDVQGK